MGIHCQIFLGTTSKRMSVDEDPSVSACDLRMRNMENESKRTKENGCAWDVLYAWRSFIGIC